MIFFNATLNERPNGRFVEMQLFIPDAKSLSPGEYITVKRFLSEANNLWRISSRDVVEESGTT